MTASSGGTGVPATGTIVAYDDFDHVGRLQLSSGEILRFGRTVCQDFIPSVGLSVVVTAVGVHPLGGLKATALQAFRTPEETLAEEQRQHDRDKDAERDRIEQHERAVATTTPAAIVTRIKSSLLPDEDYDADETILYDLTDDLDRAGPSIVHIEAIFQAISQSPPMAHFGDPGPLVHYAERWFGKGYEEALFKAARVCPTYHFFWMLARLAKEPCGSDALSIIQNYATHPNTPNELRVEVEAFLKSAR